MFEHGLFEDDPEPSAIPVEEHGETAREVAEGGITLLKNSDAVLPLDGRRLDSVAVIGGDANRAHAQGGASHVTPTYQVSLRRRASATARRAASTSSTRRAPTRSARPRCCRARPPRRRRSSRPPGGGQRAAGRRTSPRPTCPAHPIMTRTEPRRALRDQGFLGGGPFFGSLYGSQLPPTPFNARLGALHRHVHRARGPATTRSP